MEGSHPAMAVNGERQLTMISLISSAFASVLPRPSSRTPPPPSPCVPAANVPSQEAAGQPLSMNAGAGVADGEPSFETAQPAAHSAPKVQAEAQQEPQTTTQVHLKTESAGPGSFDGEPAELPSLGLAPTAATADNNPTAFTAAPNTRHAVSAAAHAHETSTVAATAQPSSVGNVPGESAGPRGTSPAVLCKWRRGVLQLPIGVFRSFFSPELQEAARERLVAVTVYGSRPGPPTVGPAVLECKGAQLRFSNGGTRLTCITSLMRSLGVPDGGSVQVLREPSSGGMMLVAGGAHTTPPLLPLLQPPQQPQQDNHQQPDYNSQAQPPPPQREQQPLPLPPPNSHNHHHQQQQRQQLQLPLPGPQDQQGYQLPQDGAPASQQELLLRQRLRQLGRVLQDTGDSGGMSAARVGELMEAVKRGLQELQGRQKGLPGPCQGLVYLLEQPVPLPQDVGVQPQQARVLGRLVEHCLQSLGADREQQHQPQQGGGQEPAGHPQQQDDLRGIMQPQQRAEGPGSSTLVALKEEEPSPSRGPGPATPRCAAAASAGWAPGGLLRGAPAASPAAAPLSACPDPGADPATAAVETAGGGPVHTIAVGGDSDGDGCPSGADGGSDGSPSEETGDSLPSDSAAMDEEEGGVVLVGEVAAAEARGVRAAGGGGQRSDGGVSGSDPEAHSDSGTGSGSDAESFEEGSEEDGPEGECDRAADGASTFGSGLDGGFDVSLAEARRVAAASEAPAGSVGAARASEQGHRGLKRLRLTSPEPLPGAPTDAHPPQPHPQPAPSSSGRPRRRRGPRLLAADGVLRSSCLLKVRLLRRGCMPLRLAKCDAAAWHSLLSSLVPDTGGYRELQLWVGEVPYSGALLLRRAGPGGRGAAMWTVGGLGPWMQQQGAREGDIAELCAGPDGRLSLSLRPGEPTTQSQPPQPQPPQPQDLQTRGLPTQEPVAAAAGRAAPAAVAVAGAVQDVNAGWQDPCAARLAGDAAAEHVEGAVARTVQLSDKMLAEGTLRLGQRACRALFGGVEAALKPSTDVRVRLVDESDGQSYEAFLRAYYDKNDTAYCWVIKQVRRLILRHGMRRGDEVIIRRTAELASDTVCFRFVRRARESVDVVGPLATAAADATQGGCTPVPAVPPPATSLKRPTALDADADGAAPDEAAGGPPAKRPRTCPVPCTAAAAAPAAMLASACRPPGGGVGSLTRSGSGPGPGPSPKPAGPGPSLEHLHGCVPPRAQGGCGLPALRPGELRLCGLTFHPALAAAVRRVMAEWEASLGHSLAEADPAAVQVQLLPAAASRSPPPPPPPAAAAMASKASASGAAAGAAPAAAAQTSAAPAQAGHWRAVFEQHRLSANVVCSRLARLLGLLSGDREWDTPLPEECWEVAEGLEPVGDPERGGAGLAAAAAIRRNAVLGVVGGYVMPAAAAQQFVSRGFRDCGGSVTAELAQRAAPADLTHAWQFMATAFRLPYMGMELEVEGAAGPALLELNMLGYGNMTALVNDPRVQPRAWLSDNDVDLSPPANCMVVPVSVRGLVLPVLVALRDIAPGEQLLRDYGPGWWRDLSRPWENLDFDGVAPEQLLHPAVAGPVHPPEEEDRGEREPQPPHPHPHAGGGLPPAESLPQSAADRGHVPASGEGHVPASGGGARQAAYGCGGDEGGGGGGGGGRGVSSACGAGRNAGASIVAEGSREVVIAAEGEGGGGGGGGA